MSLLWAPVVIALYALSRLIYRRFRSPLTLPIALTGGALIALLLLARLPLAPFVEGTRPIAWWLGPATVALAVPVFRERARLRAHARAVSLAVLAGAIASIGTVLTLGVALRVSRVMILSLVPKSVTTPIAMPIAERLGGIPEVTAAVVVVTGMLGMLAGPELLGLIGVRHPIARGLAMGTGTHGIGTARALEESPLEGAMSGVAMVVSGVVTVVLAPILVRLVFP